MAAGARTDGRRRDLLNPTARKPHWCGDSPASGIIVGFGVQGYVLAIHGLHQLAQSG